MVKGAYSRMVPTLQLSGGSQDMRYILALLMDTYFGLMDNILPQMMVKISQMFKLSKS